MKLYYKTREFFSEYEDKHYLRKQLEDLTYESVSRITRNILENSNKMNEEGKEICDYLPSKTVIYLDEAYNDTISGSFRGYDEYVCGGYRNKCRTISYPCEISFLISADEDGELKVVGFGPICEDVYLEFIENFLIKNNFEDLTDDEKDEVVDELEEILNTKTREELEEME